MTDFKKLCKDLVDDLSLWMEYGGSPCDVPFEEACTYRLIKRAYAALAETEDTDREYSAHQTTDFQ